MPFSWFKKSTISPKDKADFFVITAIFNPASFQSRIQLYHKFSQHMKETGAQLVTIECIFPSIHQHTFQVTERTNPLHIQLKSESIYWMKENLINIAVSRLPPNARWVCWLDGDINFHNENWIEKTIRELQKYTVVQMFEKGRFLGPDNKVLRRDYSFGYSVVNGKIIDQNRYDEWYPHPGYGWAMSVKDFREMNGLPEYAIVGSGDLHFSFSLINKVSKVLEAQLNPEFKKVIVDHSSATFAKLSHISKSEYKQIVGFVPVTISHNWHGSRKDRQYVDRWKILIAHDFNFLRDVCKSAVGLLILNPEKSSLQSDILTYFQLRKEDQRTIGMEADRRAFSAKAQHERRQRNDPTDPIVFPYVFYDNLCQIDNTYREDECVDDGHHEPLDPCETSRGHYSDNYFGTVECTSQY